MEMTIEEAELKLKELSLAIVAQADKVEMSAEKVSFSSIDDKGVRCCGVRDNENFDPVVYAEEKSRIDQLCKYHSRLEKYVKSEKRKAAKRALGPWYIRLIRSLRQRLSNLERATRPSACDQDVPNQ